MQAVGFSPSGSLHSQRGALSSRHVLASANRRTHAAQRGTWCQAQHTDGEAGGGGSTEHQAKQAKEDALRLQTDPEAKYRTYGRHFGKRPSFLEGWVESAPRVRVRSARDKARDQLADLAMVNERLAGSSEEEAARIRRRLEYLKRRRRNWELVYQVVTRQEALCTLSAIEEANRKVEELLSEESRESSGVGDLKRQLLDLQGEVTEAHQRLHATQSRVEQNLRRINELKAEASRLERMQAQLGGSSSGSSEAVEAASSAAAADVAAAAAAATGEALALTLSDAAARRGAAAAPAAAAGSAAAGISSSAALGQQQQQRAASLRQRQRGLQSSLELEEELRNNWFIVHFSSKLDKDTLVPFDLFGEAWVLFRDADGRPACVRDECAHRACPLSLGRVVDGELECPYHGWRVNSEGTVTAMPSTPFCKGVAVSSLPCQEQDGWVWVWPGWEHPSELPSYAAPPEGYCVHAEIEIEVPVEHGLLVENLLDLAHAPFTHTTTFARGWPVPDVVKFNATKMLSGQWEPYPIEMSFFPPCVTVSCIALARPGVLDNEAASKCKTHLHQMHVCLPARRGHTRLLYRMCMDFMGWVRFVPGIQKFWRQIAGQVLGEDLVLVTGQQDRMHRGGDTWRNPVPYDKLGVRYRRWRNSLRSGGGAGGALHGTDLELGAAEPAAELGE